LVAEHQAVHLFFGHLLSCLRFQISHIFQHNPEGARI
jgi:hypothetical protein